MRQKISGYDYVIVGGGSAGCLLANRLSKNPQIKVLLLEAGDSDDYFWIPIPVGYLYTIGNPRTDWCFKTEPDEGLNGRSLGYARGKVMGGCTSINAMIYMRGQRSDYDHWNALGNKGWSWDEVLPYFKVMEDYVHGSNEHHGHGGELPVQERRVNWEVLDAWRDAAAEVGIPKIKEFNTGDNFGNSYFQMNQRNGVRWNAVRAFLWPIKKRQNLTIMKNTHVERFILDTQHQKKRVIGVDCVEKNRGKFNVEIGSELILSAGSIGSPHILELSGVGDGELSKRLGIPLIHKLDGVGKNLQDHLQIRLQYKVKNTITLNDRVNSIAGKIKMGLEYFMFHTGPLTMPPSQLGAFAKSDESQNSANIEWHVQPLSLDKFGEPLHSFSAITPSVCNLRPTSRGQVSAISLDPLEHPRIKMNYLSTREDKNVAVDSIRLTRKIMKAKALQPFCPEEFQPGLSFENEEELISAAGDLGSTIFHPVGTCKMGSDKSAVVSDRLLVHGMENLRIIDASVMPTITSGNTNAPTMMIAEKGAEFILQDR